MLAMLVSEPDCDTRDLSAFLRGYAQGLDEATKDWRRDQ